jgi:glutamate N-acetyltransferase/amino-acid N-acetyltransferase
VYTPLPGGGATSPQGFRAGVAAAGLRYRDRTDVALLVSDVAASAAGVFTRNRVQAAPVRVAREALRAGRARAVVVNSGIANACTGEAGLADARAMAVAAGEAVGCPPEEVVVASTGVIGVRLPMDRLAEGIRAAARDLRTDGGADAAEAIRTTDTRRKESALRLPLPDGRTVTIGGMCKGSGMIHPNMGTMLAFLTTDAAVPAPALRAALAWAVDRSFNCVSVDGDQSTNDTCVVLANGLAGNAPIEEGSEAHRLFCEGLCQVATDLAKAIAADGEGATRLIEVVVEGCESDADARRAARAIVASNLVKSAVHGRDANWGRILSSAGASGVEFDDAAAEVYLGPLQLVRDGVGVDFDEATAVRLLGQPVVRIEVRLGRGWGRGAAWGCDLSEEYVRINGSYRS